MARKRKSLMTLYREMLPLGQSEYTRYSESLEKKEHSSYLTYTEQSSNMSQSGQLLLHMCAIAEWEKFSFIKRRLRTDTAVSNSLTGSQSARVFLEMQ